MPEQTTLTEYDRRQRTILRIGAIYDAGFGVPIFFAPNFLFNILRIPQVSPDGQVWLALDGIFLIILGVIYWIMSGNPSRYLALIGVILLGKVASIAFYLTCVFVYGQPRTFLLFAALDAVMAALHFWALGPNGVDRIKAALQPLPVAAV
jgi:hypothetical protein